MGFGRVLFDRWITASGHLVVVRMITSRFDKANVTGPAASGSRLDNTGLYSSFFITFTNPQDLM